LLGDYTGIITEMRRRMKLHCDHTGVITEMCRRMKLVGDHKGVITEMYRRMKLLVIRNELNFVFVTS
jgi:hypothetical protein